MGSTTESSAYGITHNPRDLERTAGGSSGGSAAVVAARMVPLSLGSDTGGSIRQPAACCGVVGLKPTYGRVSRYGLVAYASSLDQIGPFANTVRDAALLLSVIAGHDEKDSTSSRVAVPDYVGELETGVRGLVIGLPKEYFGAGLQDEVKTQVLASAESLKSAGAIIREVTLPNTEFAIAAYYIIATAEASSNLARFDGVKYGFRNKSAEELQKMVFETRSLGFGPEVKRRIMLGNYVLSSGYYDAYYKKAQQVRTLLKKDFERVFGECDAILSPVMPTLPHRIGEHVNDPLSMYLEDIYTISANLAGLPGLVVPFGKASGLPVGVQLMGRGFEESTLFRIGRVLELAQ